MDIRTSRRGSSLAVIVLLLGIVAQRGYCQQASAAQQPKSSPKRPLIVLTSLNAPEDDPIAMKLAATITSSTALVMRLAGGLVVKRADFLTPSLSLSRAELYYKQIGADGAVFGSVMPASGGAYTAKLEIWNAEKSKEKPVVFQRTIENPLEIFAISDQLSLQAGSTIVGRTLASGTLVLKNTGFLPRFSVYADGELLGRDKTSFQVLTGPRKIVVAKPGGPLGEEPVEAFETVIHDHQTTDLTLTEKPKVAKESGTKAQKGAAGAAKAQTQATAGRPVVPTFAELNSQFKTLRSRDLPFSIGFWASYAAILGGVIVEATAPPSSSGSLTLQQGIGWGILAAGAGGFVGIPIFDPHRVKLKDMKVKIGGLPVMRDDQSLSELRSELKAYQVAELPYTLTYWGSVAAIVGGLLLAVNSSGTTQTATGIGLMYAGLGGVIGTASADPYRQGIRLLRSKINASR